MRVGVVRIGVLGLGTLAASVAVGGLTTQLPSTLQNGVWLPLVVLALMLGAAIAVGVRDHRDPFSPLVVLPVVLLLLYFVRPLYILSSGRFGPTRAVDDRAVTPDVLPAIAHALWLAVLGIGCLLAGFALHGLMTGSIHAVRARGKRSNMSFSLAGRDRVVVVLGSALALTVYGYWVLVRQAGGFSQYLSALSLRGGFFFGHAYVVAITLPLKVTALILAASIFRRSRIGAGTWFGLVFVFAVVAFGDFLTGGRAGLLLGTLLPVVMLYHYVRRPLRARAIGLFVVAALIIFVAARVVTRDAIYAQGDGQSRVSILESSLLHLPTTTVGGREAIEFDSLVTLVRNPQPRLLLGRTYAPIVTFPIPRTLWAGKPIGGGNTWFTQAYFPEYYALGRTETSVSFFGETLANFGIAGIALLSFLFGSGLAAVYAGFRREGGSPLSCIYYAITLGYSLTLIRGDAFHSVTWLAMTVLLTMGGVSLLTGRLEPEPLGAPVLPELANA
jgi:oligosaccharide repeat unit polymerase